MVASALVLSLILKTFVFQSFWIPSESMQNTLQKNDRILVSLWTPGPFDLERGDVVVFKDPGGWLPAQAVEEQTGLAAVWTNFATFTGLLPADAGEHLVKRVIGLPGDTVACDPEQGVVTVNGAPIDEPYVMEGTESCAFAWQITVEEGRLWVLGDNRSNSADSRSHIGDPGGGTIPQDAVVGTAFVTVWPVDHWSGL